MSECIWTIPQVAHILINLGKTTELDSIARAIWIWRIERHIHLSAAHIPGKDNCEADEESRRENDDTEW